MPAAPSITELALREWSTEHTPEADRLDYWVGAICEAFLEMDCSSSEARAFDGHLKRVEVSSLAFNQVQSSTQDVYRTRRGIARSSSHPFYLITHRDTTWHVRQEGCHVGLRPGDSVLLDSSLPYELHFPGAVSVMSVQLPRAWLGQWLANLDAASPRLIHRDAGWGRALSGLVLQFAHDPLLATQYPANLLCDQLGAMLAASLEPAPTVLTTPAADLLHRALRLLEDRLDHTGLTSEQVATALGVSVRTLHRAFAAGKCTLAGRLRQLRLQRAAELLVQARLQGLGMADIGHRCGFADASHFVREFQRQWGTTPARWRREHLQRRAG